MPFTDLTFRAAESVFWTVPTVVAAEVEPFYFSDLSWFTLSKAFRCRLLDKRVNKCQPGTFRSTVSPNKLKDFGSALLVSHLCLSPNRCWEYLFYFGIMEMDYVFAGEQE